ncbi:ComEA family DNA-binding protein [Streptomyces sp. NPDC004732]|uniref:ComEA family DNA-binding protein n=1 Tax=Streptomyces sp. NPDC004732 TaxID=3154290 RepID=UPI0033A65734
MALRSLSRTSSTTSGPGRGPASDGRAHTSDRHARERARRRRASAEAVRRRAESLFAEPQPQPPPPPSPSPSPRLDVAAPDAGLAGGVWAGGTSGPRVPRPGWAREAEAAAGAEAEEAVPGDERQRPEPSRRQRQRQRQRLGLAVRERLPMWLQTRCGLERRAVVALAVILGVAAVFAAQHFWTGRAQPVRPPDVVRAAGAVPERGAEPDPSPGPPARAGRASADAGGGAGAVHGEGAGGAIVVDVSGKVRRPGVHRLPAGSRVADALRAAGGVRPGTETDDLNRARFLVDGEQVVVGGPPTAGGAGGAGGVGTGAGAAVGAGAGPPGAAATGPVGLNTATAEQLDELPGVGPVLAQHILDYRAEHGGFRSVEELREVNGIGDRRFADLQGLVRP